MAETVKYQRERMVNNTSVREEIEIPQWAIDAIQKRKRAELAAAQAEIESWAKRWPEACASLENLQAELTGKKLELRRVRKFLEEAQAKIAQLRSAWEDEGWSGSTAVRSDYVVCPGCGQNHDGDTVEFVDISEGMQGEDQLTYRCPAPNAPRDLHTSTVFRSRRHLRRRKEEDSRYPLLKGDRT
jgi:DNA repair exonuclease SbcCD ATPase subunit